MKPDERSPVFTQFLDCLFQLMHQFPTVFEYNEQTLVFLADHHYSCLFGTFLGNYDKMRVELELRETTVSIWSYLLEYRGEFKNPRYSAHAGPIWPCCSINKLRLWERFFLRWSPDGHPPTALGGDGWHDNW